ncbi:transposase, partial [Desulfitispora alkaliphila]|uniref:IS1634 family transposase n=1 Tax=Desulfitispora alkaliphila TaxID=622674 RepID=UPI003D25CC93
AIIRQTDKRTGITYVYESVSYWDKEKQQSRAKRKLIGKVDPATGDIVPTRKKKVKEAETTKNPGPVPAKHVKRSFYGATYLLDEIGEKLGITEDLKRCFPDRYKQILSMAYYLILEDRSPLRRFPKWSSLHKHPYNNNITSQRSSELFASISEDERYQFFCLQGKRRTEKEYWAYDTTSISSYSKGLKQVRYGHNKEGDYLPQINLALLFGEESNLPFYYRKLPGNIADVKTIKNLIADMDFLEYKKIKLVMDRGFYSEKNINALFQNHLKFLMGARLSLKFVKNELDKVRSDLRTWTNYSQKHELYAFTQSIKWSYSQERPYKGDTLAGERRMYLHLYFNSEKALEDEKEFNTKLINLQEELVTNKRRPEHEKLYIKYFDISSTPVRGIKVIAKQKVIDETKRNYGYFALISNEIKDPITALETYRNKDLVEKAFGNLKERLNMRRMLVSSDASLDGKLFVQFIALIFLSYMKKKMQDNDLIKKHTLQDLFDEFDIIECYHQPGFKLRIGEVTQRQIDLYKKVGVTPPTSLQ